MAIWQTEPNYIYYTDENLYCDICKKQVHSIIQIENSLNVGFHCCFTKDNIIHSLFKDKEYIKARLVIDTFYDKRKKIQKREKGKLTLKLRYEILKRDKYRCVICGKPAGETKIEIDHIIPISQGGKTILSNLRTLCFSCNRGKGIDYDK